jgi:hypothetical protein
MIPNKRIREKELSAYELSKETILGHFVEFSFLSCTSGNVTPEGLIAPPRH